MRWCSVAREASCDEDSANQRLSCCQPHRDSVTHFCACRCDSVWSHTGYVDHLTSVTGIVLDTCPRDAASHVLRMQASYARDALHDLGCCVVRKSANVIENDMQCPDARKSYRSVNMNDVGSLAVDETRQQQEDATPCAFWFRWKVHRAATYDRSHSQYISVEILLLMYSHEVLPARNIRCFRIGCGDIDANGRLHVGGSCDPSDFYILHIHDCFV